MFRKLLTIVPLTIFILIVLFLTPSQVEGQDTSLEPDYIIITDPDNVDVVQPLAQWKTQTGLPAQVYTTEQIFENYSGRDNPEKIRHFLQELENETDIHYLLLAGDMDTVPVRAAWCDDPFAGDGEEVPTDTYYAFLNGSWDQDNNSRYGDFWNDSVVWEPDVYVGRLPFSDPDELGEAVDNILCYQQDPAWGGWFQSALFAAGMTNYRLDEDNDGVADYNRTDEARLAHSIETRFLPEGFNVTRLYEGAGIDPSSYDYDHALTLQNVTKYLGEGHSVVSLSGHGSRTGMFRDVWAGDYDEDGFCDKASEQTRYTMFDTGARPKNQDMRPLVYLSACYNGYYDAYETSLAQHTLKNVGIGVVASSQAAWYQPDWEPGEDGGPSNQGLEYRFWEQFFTKGLTPGAALYESKADFVREAENLSVRDVKDLFSYNFFGDPALPVWTSVPRNFSVEHPIELKAGQTEFDVLVMDQQGQQVENATVTASNLSFYQITSSDSEGKASISLDIHSSLPLTLTVSGPGFIPFQYHINGLYPPWLDNISASCDQLFRGDSVKLFVNGSDRRDPDVDLVCQLQVLVPGGNWTNMSGLEFVDAGEFWTAVFSFPSFADVGNYSFRAQLTDSQGCQSGWLVLSHTITLHNQGPSAFLDTVPPLVLQEGEQAVFAGHGEDDREIGNYLWHSDLDAYISDKASFSTTTLSNGTHLITFNVKDDDGNWSEAVSTTVRVNGKPQAAFLELRPALAVELGTVLVFWHGADDGAVTEFTLASTVAGPLYRGDRTSLALKNLTAGPHILVLRTCDDEGVWSQETMIQLMVHQRPVATIPPLPDTLLLTEAFQFEGLATDDNLVVLYRWSSSIDGPLHSGPSASFSCSNLSLGTHTLSFQAQDEHGAWSEEARVTVTVRLPNRAPEITVTSPGNGSTVNGSVTLTGSVKDRDGVIKSLELSVNGGTWSSLTDRDDLGSFQWNYQLDTTGLANGEQQLRFRASDGEDETAMAWSLTVDNSEEQADEKGGGDEGTSSLLMVLALVVLVSGLGGAGFVMVRTGKK